MSEKNIRQELFHARAALHAAATEIDSSTEYLEDEVRVVQVLVDELLMKMDRDAALQRDREAFSEPSPGLKEWLDG